MNKSTPYVLAAQLITGIVAALFIAHIVHAAEVDPPKLALASGSSATVALFQPAYAKLTVGGWLEATDSSVPAGQTISVQIFQKPETVKLVVKTEPVVTANADGTWTISFKPKSN